MARRCQIFVLGVAQIGEEHVDGRPLESGATRLVAYSFVDCSFFFSSRDVGGAGRQVRDERRRVEDVGGRVDRVGDAEHPVDPLDLRHSVGDAGDLGEGLGSEDVGARTPITPMSSLPNVSRTWP